MPNHREERKNAPAGTEVPTRAFMAHGISPSSLDVLLQAYIQDFYSQHRKTDFLNKLRWQPVAKLSRRLGSPRFPPVRDFLSLLSRHSAASNSIDPGPVSCVDRVFQSEHARRPPERLATCRQPGVTGVPWCNGVRFTGFGTPQRKRKGL
jgi:hypothetical protein